jgi:hypothetical protein
MGPRPPVGCPYLSTHTHQSAYKHTVACCLKATDIPSVQQTAFPAPQHLHYFIDYLASARARTGTVRIAVEWHGPKPKSDRQVHRFEEMLFRFTLGLVLAGLVPSMARPNPASGEATDRLDRPAWTRIVQLVRTAMQSSPQAQMYSNEGYSVMCICLRSTKGSSASRHGTGRSTD